MGHTVHPVTAINISKIKAQDVYTKREKMDTIPKQFPVFFTNEKRTGDRKANLAYHPYQ